MFHIKSFVFILILNILSIESLKISHHSNHFTKKVSARINKLQANNIEDSNVNLSIRENILIPCLSLVGAMETGYLSWSKITSSQIADFCTQGTSCQSILSSPYSEIPIANVPLSLIAAFIYTIVFFLSINPDFQISENKSKSSSQTTVLFLSTAMATFSIYLMFVLNFVLKTACNYCYLSAGLTFSLAALSWKKNDEYNNSNNINSQRSLAISSTSALMTAVFSSFLFYITGIAVSNPQAVDASTAPAAQFLESVTESAARDTKKRPPTVTQPSTPEALALAKKLQMGDAKMYGAYWCSHCFNQKQNFGVEASELIKYIECDNEGFQSQNRMCKAKKVPGYPTWEIKGRLFPGEKSLTEIERILNEP